MVDGNGTKNTLDKVVFDEEHCIYKWGYDFRRKYLNIGETLTSWCSDVKYSIFSNCLEVGRDFSTRASLLNHLVEKHCEVLPNNGQFLSDNWKTDPKPKTPSTSSTVIKHFELMASFIFCFALLALSKIASTLIDDLYPNSRISNFEILQLKFKWNATNKCDLTTLFRDNSVSFECMEVKDTLQISTEYLFVSSNASDEFKPLDFFLDLDILTEMRASFDDPDRNIFLEWHSQNNSFIFIGTNCIQGFSENNCSNVTDIHQSSLFIKFIEENDHSGIILSENIEIKYSNGWIKVENLDYELEDAFIRVFNETDILVDLPLTDNEVNVADFIDLPQQDLKVSLYGLFDLLNLLDRDEIALVQLNGKIFTNTKKPDPWVYYETNFTNSKIKLETGIKTLDEIEKYIKIDEINRKSANTIEVSWTSLLPKANYILNCSKKAAEVQIHFPQGVSKGQCSFNSTLSGHLIKVNLLAINLNLTYESSESSIFINPDPVKKIFVNKTTAYSAKLSWTPPDGQYDGFILNLIGPSSSILSLGPTDLSQNINYLLSNSIYTASISVRSNNLKSNRTEIEFKTNKTETVYELEIEELDEIIPLMPSESLIELADVTIDKFQTNNSSLTKQTLNKSSKIIQIIAETSENSAVILKMLDFSDTTFNQSDEFYENDFELSGRLSMSLEKLASKVDVSNFSNNNFASNYTNFYLKTKNILKSFTLSDLAFNINGTNNYSNFDDAYFESNNLKYDVYFNKDLIEDLLSKNTTPRLSFIAYNSQKFFKSSKVSELYQLEDCIKQTFLTFNVLSASSLQYLPPTNDLVNIIFPKQQIEEKCSTVNYTFKCVFWDYTLNNWSPEGCNYKGLEKNGKIIHKCNCSHLSHFAILFLPQGFRFPLAVEQTLIYVSICGICLSIFGLTITIGFDILIKILPSRFHRKIKSPGLENEKKIGKNYLILFRLWCLTLLVMNVIYLLFSFTKHEFDLYPFRKELDSKLSKCIAVGALFHFFLLSSFCFSASISYIQFLIAKNVFKTYRYLIIKSLLPSVIVPTSIVIGVILFNKNAYIRSDG
ncbi:G-coupled receptor -like protein [Brachionus plicatilis]|uniref:G-coupled receptor-like protein n=1 Tax=Brachionus plicatilis TaxID=10195 RepID=A0A3M7R3Z8_BRAPC|nr:G-coupled receptor -like protein [Brachionus plicatilis]